jgi:hypothetical protein
MLDFLQKVPRGGYRVIPNSYRVPNTIEEEVIKTTLDKELKKIEQTLLTTDRTYKLTKEQSKNWIRYVVVRDYPMGMPWDMGVD